MFHKHAPRNFLQMRFLRLFFHAAMVFMSVYFTELAQASRLRIVSLAPSVTEWIYALGLGHALVGVTEQCDYPTDALKIAKIGSFMQTSVESVLMKKPTHVVTVDGMPVHLSKKLTMQGIRVHVLSVRRLGDFPDQILKLGEELGVRSQAVGWADKLRKTFVQQISPDGKAKDRGNALLLVSSQPMYVATPESWLSELFALNGWRNALKSVHRSSAASADFQKISIESALASGAKRWVLFADVTHADRKAVESARRIFPNKELPSGIELVVYPADVFTRPGPRLLSAFAMLGEEQK